MGWVSGIVVFLLTWWTVIFMVLPWGVQRDEGDTARLHGGCAPSNPNLKKKLAITTVLAAVIWIIIYILMEMDIISFHDLATQMVDEDNQRRG